MKSIVAESWIWFGLAGVVLAIACGVYVRLRWRAAPSAYRALLAVGILSLVSGGLIGSAAVQRWNHFAGFSESLSTSNGKVSARIVGNAIVRMDERHAGDPNWIPSAEHAEICKSGALDEDSLLCRVT